MDGKALIGWLKGVCHMSIGKIKKYCRDVIGVELSRGSQVLIKTLGAEFDGTIGCDYFSAYHKFMRLGENVKLQFCIAHLIRDIKFLCVHPDEENRVYGERP